MKASHTALSDYFVRFSMMLVVRDLSVSEAFYCRYFDFQVEERSDGLLLLKHPHLFLYLITESPPTVDKPTVTLAPLESADRSPVNIVFRVRDVRTVYTALQSQGLTFLAPPVQPAWGGWRCFAQDPDGYLIEIEQP